MMETVPVISSIISPDYLASLAQKKYHFSGNVQCSILKTGINHTYLLSDGERKAIIRVYTHNWRSKSEISEELALLISISKSGISAAYPLKDHKDGLIQEIQAPEGNRFVCLFSFADGNKLRNFTNRACKNVGTLMAKFHLATENQALLRVKYDRDTLMELSYQHALRYFSKENKEMVYIRKLIDQSREVFDNVDDQQLRSGIVHMDLWYDNMNVNNRSKVTIFDFDFCGNGWQVLDIAYYLMQLFHTVQDKELLKEKITSFLAGYQENAEITREEIRLLREAGIAMWIFYLGVQSQRYADWSNLFLSENYLERFIGMLRSWLKYYDEHLHDHAEGMLKS